MIVSYVTMTQLIATRNAGLTQRHNSSNNQNSASVHFDQIQYALLCPCFAFHIIVHQCGFHGAATCNFKILGGEWGLAVRSPKAGRKIRAYETNNRPYAT